MQLKKVFGIGATALTLLSSFSLPSLAMKKGTRVDILGDVSGFARVRSTQKLNKRQSQVLVTIDRIPENVRDELNKGKIFEAWLVDTGTASEGTTSSVDDDDNVNVFQNGVTKAGFMIEDANQAKINFENVPFINALEAVPYALSLGTFRENLVGNFKLKFRTRNNLAPYDTIMITLEPGGNQGDFDPRPGEQVAEGIIND